MGLKLLATQFIEAVFDGAHVDLGLTVAPQPLKHHVQRRNQGEVVHAQAPVFQAAHQAAVPGGVADGHWDDQGAGGLAAGVLQRVEHEGNPHRVFLRVAAEAGGQLSQRLPHFLGLEHEAARQTLVQRMGGVGLSHAKGAVDPDDRRAHRRHPRRSPLTKLARLLPTGQAHFSNAF